MTLVIAHRGASGADHENTVTAFRRAVELGAEGIELDVRRSADGALVVHHDALLPDGRVIVDVHSGDLPDHIPTLAAALDACEGAFVNVEIKNMSSEPDFEDTEWLAHRTVEELKRRRSDSRWLVSSFRSETVGTVRRLAPSIRTALLTASPPRALLAQVAADGHAAIHPYERTLDRQVIHDAHVLGLAVNAWTCNDPDRIRRLMAWGIDGICTDVPDVALAIRADFAPSIS